MQDFTVTVSHIDGFHHLIFYQISFLKGHNDYSSRCSQSGGVGGFIGCSLRERANSRLSSGCNENDSLVTNKANQAQTPLIILLKQKRETGQFFFKDRHIILMLAEGLQAGAGIRCSCWRLQFQFSAPIPTYPPISSLLSGPAATLRIPEQPGPCSHFILGSLWASSWCFLLHKSSSLSVTDTSVYLWRVWGYLEIPPRNQKKLRQRKGSTSLTIT